MFAMCLMTLLHLSTAIVIRPFPSAEYLGLGYNLIAGNPEPSYIVVPELPLDVGWRLPILRLDVLTNTTSNDGRFSIPGDTLCDYIGGNNACNYDTITTTIAGDTSYSNMLFKEISLYPNSTNNENDLNNASFAVSPTYYKFQDFTNNKNLLISADAKCPTYHYYYNPKISFKLRDEFKSAVTALFVGVTLDYYLFLDAYGTHVAAGLQCGSRYARIHEFSPNGWNQMGWDKYDIPYVANAEYQLTINQNADYNATIKQEVNNFRHLAENVFISVLGKTPIGKIFNWLNISTFYPFPFNYELIPIVDFLTPNYFPDTPASTINRIHDNMVSAISTYCAHHRINGSLCKPHAPDQPIPPFIIPYSEPINGNGIQQCSDNGKASKSQIALSCGMVTDPTSNPDKFWSVYPQYAAGSNTKTVCAGKDNSGAQLYSICVDTSVTFTKIVPLKFTQAEGQTTATCANGYSITGCGMIPSNPGNNEWDLNKAVYGSDYNKCHCKHKYGGTCYASCSNYVNNIYLPSVVGSGGNHVNLTCGGSKRLFGCGIEINAKSGTQVSSPSFYAIDQLICTGYSKADYTLYAICGEVKS